MTTIQYKATAHEAKPDLFAGIDVGAEELILQTSMLVDIYIERGYFVDFHLRELSHDHDNL